MKILTSLQCAIFIIVGTSGVELSHYDKMRTASPAWTPSYSTLQFLPTTKPPSPSPVDYPTGGSSEGRDVPISIVRSPTTIISPTVEPKVANYEASRTGSPAWTPSYSTLQFTPTTPSPIANLPTTTSPVDDFSTDGSGAALAPIVPIQRPDTSAVSPTSPPEQITNYETDRTGSPAWIPSYSNLQFTPTTPSPIAYSPTTTSPVDESSTDGSGPTTTSPVDDSSTDGSGAVVAPILPIVPIRRPASPTSQTPTSQPQQIANYELERTRSPAWSPSLDNLQYLPTTNQPTYLRTSTPTAIDEPARGSGGIVVLPEFGCFPGDALVEIQNKGATKMEELKIGDMVRVASGNFEPIYSFGHYGPNHDAEFLEIATVGGKLRITSEHMVYERQNGFIPASAVQVGDSLVREMDDQNQLVTAIRTVKASGTYAPFTPSGTFVVDNLVVSSFVQLSQMPFFVSPQWMARAGEFPHRLVCHYLGSDCRNELYDEQGINYYWGSLPLQFLNTLQNQNVLLQLFVMAAILLFVMVFSVAEYVIVMNPIIRFFAIGIGIVAAVMLRRFVNKKVIV